MTLYFLVSLLKYDFKTYVHIIKNFFCRINGLILSVPLERNMERSRTKVGVEDLSNSGERFLL